MGGAQGNGTKKLHDDSSVKRILLDFELSKRATGKGSALDRLALLAVDGDSGAITALIRIILELRLAEHPARSVLLDQADVDDAVQTTLIAVATQIESFEGRASFKTWVASIAKNQALLVVRRKQRLTEPVTNKVPEHDHSARRLSSLVTDEAVLAKSLAKLSPEHQEILRLREELNLSYEEIAETLSIAVGTVRSRVSRARVLLAEQLVSVNPLLQVDPQP